MELQGLYYHLSILIGHLVLSNFETITLLCIKNFKSHFQAFESFSFRVRVIFIIFLRILRDLASRLFLTQISYANPLCACLAAPAQNIQTGWFCSCKTNQKFRKRNRMFWFRNGNIVSERIIFLDNSELLNTARVRSLPMIRVTAPPPPMLCGLHRYQEAHRRPRHEPGKQ